MSTPYAASSESTTLRYSESLLVVTVAALPLYVLRWHYGPVPTTLLETLVTATVALYVVGRWRDGWRRPLATAYDIPIVLLLVAGAISVVVAKDHRAAFGLYRAFFIEPVAIFYVAADLLRRPATVKRVIVALAIGSTLLAALNLVVVARSLAAHDLNVGSAPSAVYGDANYVAVYLEPPVALATALVLYAGGRLRWVGAIWLTVAGLALLLTFSKGAYLALGVLSLIAVMSYRRWRIPLIVGLLVAAAAISQVSLVKDRLSTAGDALLGRLEIFQATISMIRDHPILGLGLGGYTYVYRGFAREPYPHNIWFAFWVELGLLGLVAFAVIFFGLLWRGRQAWPRVGDVYRPALWGTLVALLLWAVHGLVDTPYWKNDMSVEFWVLAAINVAAVTSLAAARPSKPKGEPAATTIGP